MECGAVDSICARIEPAGSGLGANELGRLRVKRDLILGAIIRIKRLEAGMSVKDLAELAEVTPAAVYQWESDWAYPSLEKLFTVCVVLKTSPNEIFSWGDD